MAKDLEQARGKTGAAFWFWEIDHDDRAGFGDLIEIGEQLDLIMVRAENVSLERVIILNSRQCRGRYQSFRGLMR